MKTFILNVLSGLEVGEHSTRVGLLQYGSVVQNEFSLNAYRRRADVERAIRSMAHLASGTMTGLALRYTTEEAFSEEQGARPKSMQVPRMAMVVTDGRPQDKVEEAAAEARQAGIEIFAVGVGRVDMATLRAIGSEPHLEHVFLVANFSQIETLTTVFHDKLCAGKMGLKYFRIYWYVCFCSIVLAWCLLLTSVAGLCTTCTFAIYTNAFVNCVCVCVHVCVCVRACLCVRAWISQHRAAAMRCSGL